MVRVLKMSIRVYVELVIDWDSIPIEKCLSNVSKEVYDGSPDTNILEQKRDDEFSSDGFNLQGVYHGGATYLVDEVIPNFRKWVRALIKEDKLKVRDAHIRIFPLEDINEIAEEYVFVNDYEEVNEENTGGLTGLKKY